MAEQSQAVQSMILNYKAWKRADGPVAQAAALLDLDLAYQHAEHEAHWHYCDPGCPLYRKAP